MKLRKVLSCLLCMMLCMSQVSDPIQTALAESDATVYEDGYAVRLNADGTRTITLGTTMESISAQSEETEEMNTESPTAAKVETTVSGNGEDMLVTIETDGISIEFSPNIFEDDPPAISNDTDIQGTTDEEIKKSEPTQAADVVVSLARTTATSTSVRYEQSNTWPRNNFFSDSMALIHKRKNKYKPNRRMDAMLSLLNAAIPLSGNIEDGTQFDVQLSREETVSVEETIPVEETAQSPTPTPTAEPIEMPTPCTEPTEDALVEVTPESTEIPTTIPSDKDVFDPTSAPFETVSPENSEFPTETSVPENASSPTAQPDETPESPSIETIEPSSTEPPMPSEAPSESPTASESPAPKESVVPTPDDRPNTRIQYTELENGVKEEVIIQSYRGGHAVSYDFRLSGLMPVQEDSAFALVNEEGQTVGSISAPYMYDAAGARSTDISVAMRNMGDGCYRLSYTPSDSWLADSGRAYPVVIDPTITIQGARDGEDNYVTDGDKSDKNYTYDADYLYVGNREGCNYISYIRPVIPNSLKNKAGRIIIKDVTMTMYASNVTGSQTYSLHLVTGGPWSSKTITHANSPAYSSEAYQKGGINSGKNVWNVKNVFSEWFNALAQKENCGFVLKGDGTEGAWLRIKSADYGSAATGKERIKFVVTYEEVGGELGLSVSSYGNGRNSGTGYVDLTWNAIANAEGYYVGIYDGKDYEYFYVGNVTSFSTKGKGLWPTQEEIDAGRYALHGDGTGGELPAIPAFTYRNVEGGSHASDLNYYFRVVPANEFGQAVNPDLYLGVSTTLPDTIAPNQASAVSIDPANYTNLNQATVAWSGIMDYNGSATISGSLGEGGCVQYAVDSTTEWRDTDVNAATGSYTLDISACDDGQHAVYIRGMDANGNTGAYRGVQFYIDRTGPVFAQMAVLPDRWSNADEISIIWSGLSERGQIAKIETAIDGGVWTNANLTSAESTGYAVDVSSLSDGEHTLSLRATDDLGNVGAALRDTFYIDRTAPEIESVTASPTDWTNAGEIQLRWSGVADADSGIATMEYQVDGGFWTQISNITEEGSFVLSTIDMADGKHTINLRTTDLAGNAYEQSAVFRLDTQPPVAFLSTPSNGALLHDVVEIQGTVQDSQLSRWTLTATGMSGESIVLATSTESVDAAALGQVDLRIFANGENVRLTLTAEDAAGNITQETVTIVSFIGLTSSFVTDVATHLPDVIAQAQRKGDYILPEGVVEQETYLYIDGVRIETLHGGKILIDAAKYSENSTHTGSVIVKDDSNALHYDDGFGAISLVDEIYNGGAPTSDGVFALPEFSAPKPMLALRLNATDYEPSGTSIRYEYSTGGAWQGILPGQDVLLEKPATEVSLRAILMGEGEEQPAIYQIQLLGIVEVNPRSFRVHLLDAVENFKIELPSVLNQALTPFETTLSSSAQARYYADGTGVSEESVLDARLLEEGTQVAISGVAVDGDVLYASGGSMTQLLREDKMGAQETVVSDAIYCQGIAAIQLKAAARGKGNYFLSCDGVVWMEIPNEAYFLLPDQTDILYLKAEMQEGAALMGWHLEGASASSVTCAVNLVQAPSQLTVLDYGKFSRKRCELTWKDLNAVDPTAEYTQYYAIYRDGEQIAVTDSLNYIDWNYVPGASYEVSTIREYDNPIDAVGRALIHESDSITGVATVMEPPKEHSETSDGLSIPEQEPLLSSLYGGDTTFSTGENVPAANVEINEKLLGKSDYCSLGFEPVNFNTGNFFLETRDALLTDAGESQLSLTRTYNTQSSTTDGVFGERWTTELSAFLQICDDGAISFREAGGARHMFTLSGEGYIADDGVSLLLSRQEDGYVIEASDGKNYRFNNVGLLVAIEEKGLRTEILRDEKTCVMTAIVLPSGQRVDFETDALGHVTRAILPGGSALSYAYEGNRLTAFTNAAGDVTRYVYDDLGRMIEWYDANGNRQVHNEYDDHGRVIFQIDANGGEYALEYFEDHTIITDAMGASSEIWFDAQRRTVREVGPDGMETRYAYNAQGYVATQTDAMGRVTTYEYDKRGNKTKSIAPDGATCTFEYDKNSRLVAQTDQNGNRTAYVYDESGNLIQTIFADGSSERREYDAQGNLAIFTDALGNAMRYEYEGSNLIRMTDALGHVTQYEYDGLNRVTATVNALGNRTEIAYDAGGNVAKITFANGAEISYTYDSLGNLLTQTDALGNTTSYEYDALGNNTAIISADGSRTEMRYTPNGQIAQVVDALGNTTAYTYDGNGNKVSETDALGHTTHYETDALNRVVREITPTGAEITYEYDAVTGLLTATTDETGVRNAFEYDATGNLTARVYANGERLENVYDAMNRLIRQTAPNGGVTEFTYDALGRLTSVTDALGGITVYTYDAMGNLIRVTDALGNATDYEYDALNRRIAVITANGARTEYEYDAAGNLVSTTDALGNVTEYEYDLNGTMLTAIDALGGISSASVNELGLLTAATQKNGGQVLYAYDALGRLTKQTDAMGGELSYAYDALGNITETTDALGQTARFSYDALGNLTEILWPDGAKASYVYDEGGRRIAEVDEAGTKTQYVYDEMNNVASTLINGATTNYAYDASGNVTKVTDAEGNSAAFEYDALGRMTATVYPDGSRDTYLYDALGRMVSEVTREGVTTTYTYDAAGNLLSMNAGGTVTAYEYDLLGRLTQRTTPDGGTTYTYDALGNLTSETDALGNVTKYEYDASSQLTAVEYANGARVRASYDLNGNAVSETDALGSETNYLYDAAGRLAGVTDALGNTTRYEYDARDNITRVVDALGHETSFEYDAAGNLTAETDALGHTTRYAYTPEGWLKEIVKPDGGTIAYTYDQTGQLTREEYSDARVVSYEYNELGRMTVTEGAEGRTKYQYDEQNRLISIANPTGDVVKYTYDVMGNRTSLTYPDGGVVRYAYDEMGRMTDVTGLDGGVTHYVYDALGRRTETSNRSLKTAYRYDAMGNVTRQTTTGDSNVDLAYAYDLNGRLIQERRTENGETVASDYTYDALGRISAFMEDGDSCERYSYDAAGNMLEKWVGDTRIAMDYNEANQMTSMSGDLGTIQYDYDVNGNLTQKVLNDTYRDSYAYDVSGNLTRYVGYDGYTVDYTYSALNLLSEKTARGSAERATLEEVLSGRGELSENNANETATTRYTYDILQTYSNVLTETINGETTSYEYGLERIAAYTATDAESVKTQYVYDARGSVIQTVTSRVMGHIEETTAVPTAAVPTVTVESYAYTPFGEQLLDEGESKVSGYGYNGEFYDAATGMLNLRARQYEPAMMRFGQQDIVRGYMTNSQSLNRYAYCVNNPIMYVDPSGESFISAVGNIWNKVKQTTIGGIIDKVIVQPAKKTVTTVINAVKQSAIGKAISKTWNQTKAALREAQAEIKNLDKSRSTYELERRLILAKACSKAVGNNSSAEAYNQNLQIISRLNEKDWLFITGGMFDETIKLETRVAILDALKAHGGKITLDDLIDVGIYTQDDLPKNWWEELSARIDLGGGVYHYADLLEGEYSLTLKGTTFQELTIEEQMRRSHEQALLVAYSLASTGYSVANRIVYGPSFNPATAYDPNNRFDQIESTGVDWGFHNEQWVPPDVLPSIQYTTKSLQHEYKHAGDFGISGNWNSQRAVEYQSAIQKHIDSATDIFQSKYRGKDAYVYYNSETGLGVYVDPSGGYIGGWKLSEKQVEFHFTNGIRIK